MKRKQTTLKQAVVLNGEGVHRAKPCVLTIKPAGIDHGIVFTRLSSDGSAHSFQAHSAQTGATNLSTVLGQGEVCVETIEHLMAAIAAYGLDNLDISVSANEMPILDGGAYQYCKAFDEAGIFEQQAPRQYLVIKKTVRFESNNGFAELLPFDGCRFDVTIDFPTPAIGRQAIEFDLSTEKFRDEVAKARTFGFLKDVDKLRAAGMAMGSSLQNSLVIGLNDEIVNPQGKHYPDEFVRHKLLDSIGDTALLGAPFIGLFKSFRGGHALNAQLVKAVLCDGSTHEYRTFSVSES